MNIPLNGRIAIIDDRYKEVKPLMDIFSKKRIPFNYYTGLRIAEFPTDADENPITLLFLDLNIVETQHNAKTVISTLHPILKAICPNKSKPYFIVVWSKKLNEYADKLDEHFKTSLHLKSKQPVKIIRLDKTEYFRLIDGDYVFEEDKFDQLQNALHNELENISLMKNLLTWENIVHHNTTETISEFASLHPIQSDWDKNMKAIMFHLAKAIIGNDDIKAATDDTRLFAAFSNLNSFLAEKIQYSIGENKLGTVVNVKDDTWDENNKKDSLKAQVKAGINSKLHLTKRTTKVDSFEQGNIYFLRSNKSWLNKILWKSKYDNINTADIIATNPKLVQVDLTPVCDYSQDKKYVRLVYGVLIDSRFSSAFQKTSDFQTRTPNFLIDKSEKFFLFDFRFIETTTKSDVIKRKIVSQLKLRREICTDIQSQLSNQVNRPGISSV